jgi:nitroreductase
MDAMDAVKKRYSVRSYMDKEVEKEKLLQVLEAGRLAPSAVNFQPVHLIVITKEQEKRKIYETYRRDWIKEAPVIIAVCGDHRTSWKRNDGKDHCDIDAAIAVDHMTLAATDLGLGTCWVCAFDARRCHELLELPDNLEVEALLPLGYPKGERPAAAKRKSLDEIVSWERYKEAL